MPTAAPDTPRKMLPPPMTRQTSTPSAWTDFDLVGDARDHGRVEAVLALAHQRLAGHLQQDAAIFEIGWHGPRLIQAFAPVPRAAHKIHQSGPAPHRLSLGRGTRPIS